MTSGDVGEMAATLLIVPLGATEQHGPHLPVSTDTDLASEWAERVAVRLNEVGLSSVVAPTLPYGSSGEHQMFPGTLSIGQDALELVIVELIRSAANDFDRVALLSGHAGNLEPVGRAVARMTAEGHDVQHLFPSWSARDVDVVDAHAGRTETSLMLHLMPDAVRIDRLSPGRTEPLSEILDELAANGVGAVSPTGVLGDPTPASADEGQHLLSTLLDRTVATLLRPTGSEPAQ